MYASYASRRPPYDPVWPPLFQKYTRPKDSEAHLKVIERRKYLAALRAPVIKGILNDPELECADRTVPGPRGDVPVTVISKKRQDGEAATRTRPGVFFIHGGALVVGDRFLGLDIDIVKEFDLVLIAVDYRLAPENPGLAPVEDCYATLLWVGEHLSELCIDPDCLIITGVSAGGNLAAATALMVRDKGGPKLRAQHLACPMLDDRNNHVSSKQYWDDGFYCGNQNESSWFLMLGDKAGSDDVSPYIAPARATDLSNLPEAFLDVGAAEPFRDEVVAYASKLWESGTQAELHVWPGAPHGFMLSVTTEPISKDAKAASFAWYRRMLATRKTSQGELAVASNI